MKREIKEGDCIFLNQVFYPRGNNNPHAIIDGNPRVITLDEKNLIPSEVEYISTPEGIEKLFEEDLQESIRRTSSNSRITFNGIYIPRMPSDDYSFQKEILKYTLCRFSTNGEF